jgi:flavodoxin
MDNRKLIYTTTAEHMAHLMRDKLEAEGINALILDQKDSSYGTFGSYEIYVLNEDVEKAKEIVGDRQE